MALVQAFMGNLSAWPGMYHVCSMVYMAFFFVKIAQTLFNQDVPLLMGQERKFKE